MQYNIENIFRNIAALENTYYTNNFEYDQKIESIYSELIQFHIEFVETFSNILNYYEISQSSYLKMLKELDSKTNLIYEIRKYFKVFKDSLIKTFQIEKNSNFSYFMNSVLEYFDILSWRQLDNYYDTNDIFYNRKTISFEQQEVSINYQLAYCLSSFLIRIKQSWSNISVAFVDFHREFNKNT